MSTVDLDHQAVVELDVQVGVALWQSAQALTPGLGKAVPAAQAREVELTERLGAVGQVVQHPVDQQPSR
jgi:hypothetical protein